MNNILLKSAFLFTACISLSNADWFRIDLTTWSHIEQTVNYIRILTSTEQSAQVTQADATGSFDPAVTHNPNKDEIHITPPAGKEKEWLSLILTAASTGGKLQFTAPVNNTSVLESPSTGPLSILP